MSGGPTGDAPAPRPPALAGLPIDHLAIAVHDLDAGSAPWRALGLPLEGPDELVAGQGVRVRALHAGDALIELLEPAGPDGPIARFLERRGPGLHHVAFRVDDLDAAIARLRSEGADFLADAPRPGRAGSRVIFLHPRWGGGVLIELVEPAGRA